MDFTRSWALRCRKLGVAGIFVAAGASATALGYGRANSNTKAAVPGQTQAIPPVSADDVSWLFPPPTRAEDFAKLIAVKDLTEPDPHDSAKRNPIWTDAVFQQFLAIASSPAAQVAGTSSRISLIPEVQSKDAWFVAGVRIDAGAPGLSVDINGQFGQSPEIRLIIQPVTRKADGTPLVHDIAGHLIFDFSTQGPPAQAGCSPKFVPDVQVLNAIVTDVVALRSKLSAGQLGTHKITTSGLPLGVHPGLVDPATQGNLRQEIQAFLERHISAEHLDAMAVAGTPAGGAPWIFLSMVEVPAGLVPALPTGGFIPVMGPTLDGQQFAQMLQPVGTVPRVVPEPHTNNLNPITCKNAAVPTANLPVAQRNGVSTSSLFVTPSPTPDKAKEVLDMIADPTRSHFFNTDCVSCHTETRRSMELLNVKNIPGIDLAALPNGPWDVRNFGWAPAGRGSFQATVTRRTAAETAAVVTYINSEVLVQPSASDH